MRIFQIWILMNSCVFIMIYFLQFLLLKYSYKKSVFICIISTILAVGVEILRIQYAFDIGWVKLIGSGSQIIIIQATALLLSKKKDSYTVFIGFSSSNFVLEGNVLACGVWVFFKNLTAAMITCTLVNIVVFIFLNYTIREICRNVISKEILWWLCLIPAMCYITFYLLLYFPVQFEQNRESIFVAVSLMLMVILFYVLILKYIYARLEEKQMVWKNRAMYAYVEGIALQLEQIEAVKKELQIIRHDMRHKDQLLMELIQNQKWKEVKEVLANDIEHLDTQYFATYCENSIINCILYSMEKKAKNLGIRLSIKSVVPEEQKVDNYELAVLIANLIENAIHAVQKLKEEEQIIKFMIKNRGGEYLLLEVRNLCDEKVKFSRKTGLPISEQGLEHGFGMVSVQEFVKKYQAEFDCYIENREFVVRIFISFLEK